MSIGQNGNLSPSVKIMQDEYKTIMDIAEARIVVKKSRFIGLGTSVDSIKEVQDFLNYVRVEYPKATHYCYAYSIGFVEKKREYSTDAGEPNNSAGAPILAAVQSSGLNNVMCMVVRYFGGIKLGIGGLIRAYGKCARQCLASASIETRVFYQTFHIHTSYQHLGAVLNLVNRLRGRVINVISDEDARVVLQIRQSMADALRDGVRSISNVITIQKEKFEP